MCQSGFGVEVFAARAINLTKLESRPTKRGLGEYCFFIDFEGHLDDELVADCLRNLAAKQAKVKFLGSYPVAGDDGHVRRKAVTKAWRDANAWLNGVPAGDGTTSIGCVSGAASASPGSGVT